MDKPTAQRLVHSTLKAPFDRGRYQRFISELCNGFDDGKAQKMAVPEAFAAHVKSCQRLGTFTSPEEELADVLVVHLTESWKLERSRTALRDFVAHKLKRGEGSDNSYKEAGLIAFVAPDSQSWRFSYVRMDYATKRDPDTGKIKMEERLTPARRYSYLVGAEEECHTAQTRFLALLQNTMVKPTLAQIEEAFSVESVTKEFFNEYARLFKATDEALNAVLASRPAMRADFAAKGVSTVDFAKKLLGQIVFLYFIQKKGWLGVGRGQAWGAGPRHFLRQLADQAAAQGQRLFNAVLEPLFYDTLATDRGAEAWCPVFKCRIPFLNGGLFEPLAGYDWEQRAIVLPNTLFTNQERTASGDIGTGILDVFDRYNFTVNEAEPLEKEVAIDPEMLGKVFENLIEENRRKGLGAFYTPREIVHYMCQESLINYLDTTVNLPDRSIERTDIEVLIREGEQAAHYETARKDGTVSYQRRLPKAIEENARALDEALSSITVCDPAIGSGAFPVGMMTEIVRARMALTPYFDDATERTAYHFKRHAIQNSLYGADIDIGAVEIAKLRLWLSLVVDEEDVQQIKPLPNLDYKVVVGNSLLGVEKNLFNEEYFKQLEALKPQFFDESDRAKKSQFKQQIDNLIHKLTQGKAVFDFEIYFSEVFHKKGGFDVVIANPPYVDSEEMTRSSKELRKICNQKFRSAKGNWDLFVVFIEQGLIKLNSIGNLSFIVPNKLLGAPYAKHIRQILAEYYICFIRDYSAISVFKEVAVYPIVFQVSKVKLNSVLMQQMASLEKADINNLIDSKAFHNNIFWDQYFQKTSHSTLIERFQKWPMLSEHCQAVASAATVSEAYSISEIMEENQNPDSSKMKKFINTGTIDPFQSLWGKQKTRYIKKGYYFPIVFNASIRSINQRRLEQADAEKLIIGGMTLNLECFYDDKGEYLAGKSTIIVLPKVGIPLLYLGAILNSKCASYWYRTFFKSMSLAGGYLRIGHAQLRQIPVPPYSNKLGRKITDLARDLVNNPESDDLWKQLNNSVYCLYELTPEEVTLIENSR